MKTPVAKPNAPVTPGRSPFMPVVFVPIPPTFLGGAAATNPFTGPREDGPHAYLNYDAVTPIRYNGQNQTAFLNMAYPKPPREDGPHASGKPIGSSLSVLQWNPHP